MAENDDVRLHTSFFVHPKTRRLKRMIGADGVLSLLRLWCYAGDVFPKGIFAGFQEEEIAEAAGWKGDPHEFVNALLSCGHEPGLPGFLEVDLETNTYSLHDWKFWQPNVYFRPERQVQAKQAIEIRWERIRKGKKKKNQPVDTDRITVSNTERNTLLSSPPKEKSLACGFSYSVGGAENAHPADGGLPGAPPPPALRGKSTNPEVEKLGEVLKAKRAELGIPEPSVRQAKGGAE